MVSEHGTEVPAAGRENETVSRYLARANTKCDVTQVTVSSEALHLGQEVVGVVSGGEGTNGRAEESMICCVLERGGI